MGCSGGEECNNSDRAPKRFKTCNDVIFLILFIGAISASFKITQNATKSPNLHQYIGFGSDSFGNVCNQKSSPSKKLHIKDEKDKVLLMPSDINITVPHFNMDRIDYKYELNTGMGTAAAAMMGRKYQVPSSVNICVKKCPGANIGDAIYTNPTKLENLAKAIAVSQGLGKGVFENVLQAANFTDEERTEIVDDLWCEDILTNAGYTDSEVLDTCENKKVMLPMSNLLHMCVPHRALLNLMMISPGNSTNSESQNATELSLGNRIAKGFKESRDAVVNYQTQIKQSCLACILVAMIVILFVQIFTKYIILLVVAGFFCASVGAIVVVWASLLSLKDPSKYGHLCSRSDLSADYRALCNKVESGTYSNDQLAAEIKRREKIAYIVTAICSTILLTICCCWGNIRLAVTLFDEAGRCVFSMPMLLFQPIIMLIVAFLLGLVFSWQMYYNMQVVVPVVEVTAVPSIVQFMSPTKAWRWAWVYSFFSCVWFIFFVLGIHFVTLAGAVSEWYWYKISRRMSICPAFAAFMLCLRYSLGSVAFGSMLIAIVTTIQLIIFLIERTNKNAASENKLFKAVYACLHCLLACVNRFLSFINRNAYIGIAVFGYGFCRAAQKSLALKLENGGRALTVCLICGFVLTLAKLISVAGSCFVLLSLLKVDPNYEDLNSVQLFAIFFVVACFSFFITSIFFSVYEMALDTIFICFCEDQNRNDGSAQRPYCSSAALQKFMRANA